LTNALSINDIAKKKELTPRWVRGMCQERLIEDASKLGRERPVDAERPIDGQVTSGKYKNRRSNTGGNS